ncbi:MAG TPA: putative collagen-binding domain-containing protein [Pirellulales bacterium]|nr:putative collagen-binding domain-containing protein [Pirellulales bacterium]
MKRFVDSFDFVRMKPDKSVIVGDLPENATVQVLAEPGVAYAVYVRGRSSAELRLKLPQGVYRAEWLNPRSGQVDGTAEVKSAGDPVTLRSPAYDEDIVLAILRSDQ